MKKFTSRFAALLALVMVLATAAFADVDRVISCGPPYKLSGSGRTIIGGCAIPTGSQGLATGDTILFFDAGSTRTPINTGAFSRITSDSVIFWITGQRRDSDDGSISVKAMYTFPGNSTPVVVGDSATITFGVTASSGRAAFPLLPGRGLTVIGILYTATDSVGVLGAYGYDK